MSASAGSYLSQAQELAFHLTAGVVLGIPVLVLGLGIVLMILGVPRQQVGVFAIRVIERLLRMTPAGPPGQREQPTVLREVGERPSG